MAHKIYLKKLFKVLIEHRTSGIYDAFLHCSVFREPVASLSTALRRQLLYINTFISPCQHLFSFFLRSASCCLPCPKPTYISYHASPIVSRPTKHDFLQTNKPVLLFAKPVCPSSVYLSHYWLCFQQLPKRQPGRLPLSA